MIIIDIEKPKRCYDCPCNDFEYGQCQITEKAIEDYDEIRKDCPIKEYNKKD